MPDYEKLEKIIDQDYYSTTERLSVELEPDIVAMLQRLNYLRDGESTTEMFTRVAATVVKPLAGKVSDELYDKIETVFYNIMASLDFLPNSPTLINAGRAFNQLAACFVVPVEDSMEGIFRGAIADMAMIQRTGGGTGFDFSDLRPAGATVSSTLGQSSGPLSFMKAFDACTDTIKQGGARRGANMGMLRVDHPDILAFIDMKKNKDVMLNFNLSVAITDEFMSALKAGGTYELKWKDQLYGTLNAQDVWDQLVDRAWHTGDPGIVFIDTINRANTLPGLGPIKATNPCGEQPLLGYEACNLGSINFANMVNSHIAINYDKLGALTKIATLFLDCVIDAGTYPLEKIDATVKNNRKIGLGVMGFASLLYKLRVRYGSNESLEIVNSLQSKIQSIANLTSGFLGQYMGNFPNIELSTFKGMNMRNATVTTIAPTGTISLLAGCSGGIEPYFALSYTKNLADGNKLQFINPYIEDYLHENQVSQAEGDAIMDYIKKNGTATGLYHALGYAICTDMEDIFVTAADVSPADHVEVQAMFQRYVDNAVSKTINFDNDVTPEDISKVLLQSYYLGCKGITVYRDGSLDSQPMTVNKVEDVPVVEDMVEEYKLPDLKRPMQLSGPTRQLATGCGMMLVTANMDENGNLYEVLMRAGSSGGCAAFTDACARLTSIALRYGVPADVIIDQLCSVRCDNFRYQSGKTPELKGKSCPDVTGKFLKEILREQTLESAQELPPEMLKRIIQQAAENVSHSLHLSTEASDKTICPECGAEMEPYEGCKTCFACGYTKC